MQYFLDAALFYLAEIFSLKTLKAILSLIVMSLSFLFGDISPAIGAFCVLVMLDFALGLSIACYKGQYNAKRLRQGLVKFILYGIALIVGHMLDVLIFHIDIEYGAQNFIVVYLGITEGLSVLKHLSRMGLILPQKLINRLEGIRDDIDLKS